MKTGKKVLLIILIIIAVAATGFLAYLEYLKPDNLEEYIVQNTEAKDMIESYRAQEYNDNIMNVEVKKNKITYSFQYKEIIDDYVMNQLKGQFDIFGQSMEDAYLREIELLEKETGFEGIQINLVISDKEGNELYRKEYQ